MEYDSTAQAVGLKMKEGTFFYSSVILAGKAV